MTPLLNIDWQSTAAMVQAVGSVAAIAAAVVIDRGAGRRLRRDRQIAAAAAVSARIDALEWCQRAIASLIREFKLGDLTIVKVVRPSDRSWRSLKGSAKALRHYLRQSDTTPADLIAAMILSREVMEAVCAQISGAAFDSEQGREYYLRSLSRAENALIAILEEYRQGVL